MAEVGQPALKHIWINYPNQKFLFYLFTHLVFKNIKSRGDEES